jgi:hypothetical protein
MYTQPSTAEQCLHNALKVSNAMKYIGIEYDIQAIDITDPNPISLMLLCAHLYQRMPQYIPKTSVEFTGELHSTVMRQVSFSRLHKIINGQTNAYFSTYILNLLTQYDYLYVLLFLCTCTLIPFIYLLPIG